jgi:hypothetical protein
MTEARRDFIDWCVHQWDCEAHGWEVALIKGETLGLSPTDVLALFQESVDRYTQILAEQARATVQ